ncbi:MAG: CDP-diacylglycerol--serine O-phosphatidyltransferase [Planctomycetota bacterium]|jgi:CDP-diacylglycerol--serine O-phosphatidyltransferase
MNKVPFWPTIATLGNLICGFSAITEALDGHFERSAWLILAAMLFDAADGRLARLTRSTSQFGGELDSLADVVSFGLAPAFLVHTFVLQNLPDYAGRFAWTASGAYAKFAWTAAGMYVICAGLRLARFNVENSTDAAAHRSFRGLPTPGAAALMATMIIYLTSELGVFLLPFVGFAPAVAIACAVLMVTKVRYPHIVSQLDFGGRPFSFLVIVVFVVMLVVFAHEIGLLLLSVLYAASGPVGLAIDQLIERLATAEDEESLF